LALLSTNSSVEYWDVRSGNLVSSFSIPHAVGQLDSVGVSPDGRLLAFVGTNGFARVWDRDSGERIAELVLDPPPKWPWLNFSPDNRLVAISCRPRDGGGGGWTVVWDFRLGVRRALPKEDVYRALFSPDGRVMATGFGNDVQLWSVPGLAPLATLRGHQWTINDLAFSRDGSVLASAGRDNDIRLWDVATGGLRALLIGHRSGEGLSADAFSPDGRTLASGELTLVKLWNVATGKAMLTISGLGHNFGPPMFSPDGNTLLIGASQFAREGPVELLQAPSLAEIDAAEAQQAKAAQPR
jgi:WD40 repeat protein